VSDRGASPTAFAPSIPSHRIRSQFRAKGLQAHERFISPLCSNLPSFEKAIAAATEVLHPPGRGHGLADGGGDARSSGSANSWPTGQPAGRELASAIPRLKDASLCFLETQRIPVLGSGRVSPRRDRIRGSARQGGRMVRSGRSKFAVVNNGSCATDTSTRRRSRSG
jgi:hypothetical protein